MTSIVDDCAAIAARLAEIERAKGIAPSEPPKPAATPEQSNIFMYGYFEDAGTLQCWACLGGAPM